MEILIVVAVLALAALGVWWAIVAERKRVAELVAWAQLGGWRFDPSRHANPLYPYDLFKLGHSRYLRHQARKRIPAATPGLGELELHLFEHHYAITTSTGKTTTTTHYYFTCAKVDARAELGHVSIRPETWGDKLAQLAGFEDIDFEDADFSKRFVVKAMNRRAAYDLLDGAMMRFLCASSARHIETRARELFVYTSSRVSPAGYDALADFVRGFLAQLPRPLVNAERERGGLAPQLEAGNASTSSRTSLGRLEH